MHFFVSSIDNIVCVYLIYKNKYCDSKWKVMDGMGGKDLEKSYDKHDANSIDKEKKMLSNIQNRFGGGKGRDWIKRDDLNVTTKNGTRVPFVGATGWMRSNLLNIL